MTFEELNYQACNECMAAIVKKKGISEKGYVLLVLHAWHPLATYGEIGEHRLVVYHALGHKELPKGTEIHHFDEDPAHNHNTNLVVCQDRNYHILLHVRQRIVDVGGDPNTQKICSTCKQLLPNSDFYKSIKHHGGLYTSCKTCHNNRKRLKWANNPAFRAQARNWKRETWSVRKAREARRVEAKA